MANSGKLNGKVDILAKAMADVFQECVGVSQDTVTQKIEGMEGRMGEKIETTEGRLGNRVEKLRKDTNDGFVEVNQRLQEHDRTMKKHSRILEELTTEQKRANS